MPDKRYTPTSKAVALLQRLVAIERVPLSRARRVLVDVLAARLSDVVVKDPAKVVAAVPNQTLPWYFGALRSSLHQALDKAGEWPVVRLKVTLAMNSPQSTRLEVSGSLAKVLTLQVYALLRIAGGHLRRCECDRLYVRVRRQQFCSERCQKRNYMKRYRAGDAGKE